LRSGFKMSVVRVGSTKQFADNWENIFGTKGKKKSAGTKSASTKKPAAKKSTAKKSTPKKAGKKSRKR
jgi:hypothetical protein